MTKPWPIKISDLNTLLDGTFKGGLFFCSSFYFLFQNMNVMAHEVILGHKEHDKNGNKETGYLMIRELL